MALVVFLAVNVGHSCSSANPATAKAHNAAYKENAIVSDCDRASTWVLRHTIQRDANEMKFKKYRNVEGVWNQSPPKAPPTFAAPQSKNRCLRPIKCMQCASNVQRSGCTNERTAEDRWPANSNPVRSNLETRERVRLKANIQHYTLQV